MPEELIRRPVTAAKVAIHGHGTQVERTTAAISYPWVPAFAAMTKGAMNGWQNTPSRLTPAPGFAKGAAFERA